jgi:hypothetical protein
MKETRAPEEVAAERALDGRLAALARADAGAEAAPRVEAALRARLADVRAVHARRARTRTLAAGCTVAAGLALALTLVPRRELPSPPTPATLEWPQPAARQTSTATGEFLPIGARVDEIEHGQVVRMQVPAGLVVNFGWPLPADDDRPRTADVLFGQDGVARAIRFLPASFRAGR